MNAFTYKDGILHAEGVPIPALAEKYGTPLYVYSRNYLIEQYRSLTGAMAEVSPLICYSMKANSNASVLKTFINEGSGIDIVSGGELYRALKAGADPSKIVFAGVGKTRDEIEYALKEQILFFTVESEGEARRIGECAAALGVTGRIAFRVNPDVDPQTHRYISTGKKENKFGLNLERTLIACAEAASMPSLEVVGLHMHIGSQILNPVPFGEALAKVRALCDELRPQHPGFKYIDIGGGIGIQYKPEQEALAPSAFADVVVPPLKEMGLQVVMEPGRNLVGNGGILVTQVQYVKDNPFAKFIVSNGAMNDLIRPALYEAHHEILPVRESDETIHGDLVGPICESGDFLAKGRDLPKVDEGDLLAVCSAGAYGFAMSSTYNSRPRAAEIMVDGEEDCIVRKRESMEDLIRGEM